MPDEEATTVNLEPSGPPKKKTFDDLLIDLGEFGRYQRYVYFFLFLPTIFSAMQKMSWAFLGASADHRCRLPNETMPEPPLWIEDDQLLISTNAESGEEKLDGCYYINDEGNMTYCDNGWVYDHSTFGSSAVMEWDLVCNSKYLKATAQALFMLGVLVGSILFGALSDAFGRRPVLICCIAIQFVFGLLSAVAPEYWTFVSARLILGSTTSGIFLVSYVLAMEMVGPSHRVLAGTLCQYYYTFGFFVMALLAYYLNDQWRWLEVALTAPTCLFILYWWVMPESVRWMIRKEKYDVAKQQILKVASVNKVDFSESAIEAVLAQSREEHEEERKRNENASFFSLFRTNKMRWRTINIFFNWFVNSGTYYGLSLISVDLGGNPYINFLLAAAVEIPAYALNLYLVNRPSIGRRISLAGCLFTAAAVLLLTILVPSDMTWLLITLSMLGKLAITSSYGIVYIFSAEVFPTDLRNVGMGGSSMCARVGGMLCPYLNLLGAAWGPLPLLVYGGLALLAGAAALLLPETLNKKLPETLEDAEAM